MKALTTLILASMIISVVIVASPSHANGEPSAGVKEGDWMEYNVNVIGTPPPIHNVTWMRIEVMRVEGAAFPVNLTVRYQNGTFYSSIWKFNFTEGNVEGWIIIPSKLSPGDTFYDNYSKTDKNIAIQSQTQKNVLATSRTVTYGNDSYRTKEWDKATGVMVRSSETLKNWSVNVDITSTNLWSPQILGLNQTVFYALSGLSMVLAVSILSSVIVVEKRRRRKIV
jgi:hypothetical protein